MSDIATQARAAAVAIEVKKDGLRQTQDGQWKITLTALELPSWLITARPGTRIMAALVEIGDDEQPVSHSSPAPAADSGPSTASVPPTTGAVPGRDAARERGRERYLMADDGERAVTRAALLPKDQAFRDHYGCNDEEAAAKLIRDACGIKSRRELASNERAYTIFRDIEFQFHGHAEVRG